MLIAINSACAQFPNLACRRLNVTLRAWLCEAPFDADIHARRFPHAQRYASTDSLADDPGGWLLFLAGDWLRDSRYVRAIARWTAQFPGTAGPQRRPLPRCLLVQRFAPADAPDLEAVARRLGAAGLSLAAWLVVRYADGGLRLLTLARHASRPADHLSVRAALLGRCRRYAQDLLRQGTPAALGVRACDCPAGRRSDRPALSPHVLPGMRATRVCDVSTRPRGADASHCPDVSDSLLPAGWCALDYLPRPIVCLPAACVAPGDIERPPAALDRPSADPAILGRDLVALAQGGDEQACSLLERYDAVGPVHARIKHLQRCIPLPIALAVLDTLKEL